jgi:hypothetical protein
VIVVNADCGKSFNVMGLSLSIRADAEVQVKNNTENTAAVCKKNFFMVFSFLWFIINNLLVYISKVMGQF